MIRATLRKSAVSVAAIVLLAPGGPSSAESLKKGLNRVVDQTKTNLSNLDDKTSLSEWDDKIGAEATRVAGKWNLRDFDDRSKAELGRLNERLSKWEKEFCEFMSAGKDPECMEQGIQANVDDKGQTSTTNQRTGETFVPSKGKPNPPLFVTPPLSVLEVDPATTGLSLPEWQKKSETAYAPVAIGEWRFAIDKLPDYARNNPRLIGLWAEASSKIAAARSVAMAPRPALAVPESSIAQQQKFDVARFAEVAYDTYSYTSTVMEVARGIFNPAAFVILEVLSSEKTATNTGIAGFVPGLHSEEKAAIEATQAYFDAIPPELRIGYDRRADVELRAQSKALRPTEIKPKP